MKIKTLSPNSETYQGNRVQDLTISKILLKNTKSGGTRIPKAKLRQHSEGLKITWKKSLEHSLAKRSPLSPLYLALGSSLSL